MSCQKFRRARRSRLVAWSLTATAMLIASQSLLWAGQLFRQQSVGGISIDAKGVISQPSVTDVKGLRDLRRKVLLDNPAPEGINGHVKLRKISLKALEAALRHAIENNAGFIPNDIKFLGGLQRIEYVFVYPEQNDIVIAGPGEGWRINETGDIVGVTTGRPVMHLDDLLVALRSARAARQGAGVSCSIDPTKQGLKQFQAFMGKQKVFRPGVVKGIEASLGPQQITLTGVPNQSRFACVMVAADYRMKRIAMNLDKSPVDGLPGFLDLVKSSRGKLSSMMPRWWLACNYEPLARSEDGLSWQLRGQGVKAMTEDDFVGKDGSVKGTGRKNPLAQKWADLMTAKYEELSLADPVFGELRNLMDLSVVAALIEKEGLVGKAGLSLPLMTSSSSHLMIDSYNAPKSVATHCSVVKSGRNWIITASGGVQIDSWSAASRTVADARLKPLRDSAVTTRRDSWWWN